MDLSQLKWLKNVKPDQGWAYDKLDDMPIPEAKIFRLHWRSKDDRANAQQPLRSLACITRTFQSAKALQEATVMKRFG